MIKKIIALLIPVLVIGCAGKMPAVDNSDKNPTAVYTSKGSISGFVIPDATFSEEIYTRSDRRLTSTKREYDSWIARQFFGNANDSVILRMDRNLRWIMVDDDGDKTYTECPLAGCAVASMKKFNAKQNKDAGKQQQFDYDPNDKKASACPLTVVQNSFKVTGTGKTRTIAGQLSKEYLANWVVEYKDKKGRKDSNRLKMVFWNTQPNAKMKEVWAINEKANKAYLKKIKQDSNVLSALIPNEVFVTLSAFVGEINKNKLVKTMSREMAKAKGYPMSTTIEWYLDRKACIEPQKAKKKAGFDWMNPIDSMTKSASDMASDKAAEMFLPDPNEPILRYLNEVTTIGVKYEHDSIFDVPAGYKRVSKR